MNGFWYGFLVVRVNNGDLPHLVKSWKTERALKNGERWDQGLVVVQLPFFCLVFTKKKRKETGRTSPVHTGSLVYTGSVQFDIDF